MFPEKDIIIAIDGYSSCGKSTFARALAAMLGYAYIDSGAMYRAVTYMCIKQEVLKDGRIDKTALLPLLAGMEIRFVNNEDSGRTETYLNDENVEDEIRSSNVAGFVSEVARIPEVRERLVAIQREMGKAKKVVMDGRDIGTVVFPDAELKIFMTANIDIRAERRLKELLAKNENVDIAYVKANLQQRDKTDSSRSSSPLRMAEDAILLDNSHMDRDQQLKWGMEIIRNKFK